jgi:hypothetical protein
MGVGIAITSNGTITAYELIISQHFSWANYFFTVK